MLAAPAVAAEVAAAAADPGDDAAGAKSQHLTAGLSKESSTKLGLQSIGPVVAVALRAQKPFSAMAQRPGGVPSGHSGKASFGSYQVAASDRQM